MSAATKTGLDTLVSASLETSELAKGFTTPMNDLLKCGVSKIVLHFNSDNTITIRGLNDNRNCICMVDYNEDLITAVDIKSECDFGIYELGEFVSLSNVFNGGNDFTVYEDYSATVEYESASFKFRGSDVDAIKEGPQSLSASLQWFAEFKWEGSAFSTFVTALSRLGQNYVRFEGKAGDTTMKMTVCDKDIPTSTFTANIDLEDEVEEDFKVILNKENLQPIIGGSVKNLKVQISNQLVYFSGSSDYHDVKYYVSTVES